jgi:hypothetical protein
MSTSTTASSSVRFLNATSNNATAVLHFGTSNDGTEVDGVAPFRPQQTATIGGAPHDAVSGHIDGADRDQSYDRGMCRC